MSQKATPAGLSFDPSREVVAPRDAATVIVVRVLPGAAKTVEVFCVVRHAKSGFLGGAVVFPGGKVDDADGAEAWHMEGNSAIARGLPERSLEITEDARRARAIAVSAARETLEEAGVVPLASTIDKVAVAAMRAAIDAKRPLADVLAEHGAVLDLGALVPFARWITPEAESRRFDARFFVVELPAGQEATSDGHETTAGFWATPSAVLDRFMRGEVQLAPPTTRCLELLAPARSFEDVVAIAKRQSLAPVCPRFCPGDPPFLALPGDPAHEVHELRVEGPTRFVLRDGRFVSEAAPDHDPEA
jgi:8-oxo-dGTP pyrophosphatase MutT (NUDIX family)